MAACLSSEVCLLLERAAFKPSACAPIRALGNPHGWSLHFPHSHGLAGWLQLPAAIDAPIEANAQDKTGAWQELDPVNPFPNGPAGPTIVIARA